MTDKLIDKELSERVLMVGVYYKHNAPGGMAAVIQYYDRYIEGLRYIASWRLSNALVRLWFAVWAYLRIFVLLLFDSRIRIVHIHTAADASFWRKSAYVRLAKSFGRKVILHVHASRFKDFYNESTKKESILRNIGMTDRLIVLSESWKEWFVGIGVDKDKIEVLHNITDYPDSAAKPEGDGRLHLLFLGEIGQRKGVFDILRGLSKHRAELEGKLTLRIGGNRNEEQLKSAIKNGGLEDMVKFEGWVSGEKKRKLLNWADVFILPSHNEGLPISILEAMSYGCPIISTPVGGIPEVVEDGKNGVIVAPGDDEGIVRGIMKYVENVELIDKESKESMKRVESYLPDYVMKHLRNIYKSLI